MHQCFHLASKEAHHMANGDSNTHTHTRLECDPLLDHTAHVRYLLKRVKTNTFHLSSAKTTLTTHEYSTYSMFNGVVSEIKSVLRTT